MNDIIAYALDFGWLQWLAVFFNIGYVVLAAKENIWCWPVSIVGVTILFFILLDERLYSDATLQVFYVVMSIYGWITWSQRSPELKRSIKTVGLSVHFRILGVGIFMTILLGMFWRLFGAAMPFIDACTTAFSILATFMVAEKILSNWIYWIIIDAISIMVYWIRDIPLIALLFVIYVVLAVFGYRTWKRQFEMEVSQS